MSETARLTTRRAEHVGGSPGTLLLEHTVEEEFERAAGLVHTANFIDGMFRFAVEDPGLTPKDRKLHTRIGCRLGPTFDKCDAWTAPLDSGRLIRMVLSCASGAVYYISLRPGETQFGVAREGEPAELGDRQMAWISDRVRALYSLGPENLGGYSTYAPALPDVPEPAPVVFEAPGADARLLDLSRRRVSPLDLHYVSAHRGGEHLFTTDVLADDVLGQYFRRVSVAERRKRYEEISLSARQLVRSLSYQLEPVLRGRLDRLVMDVEQGALYYRGLPDGLVLFGVTLRQSSVWDADRRLETIIDEYTRDRAAGPGPA
ncbi:hypothetical protein [Actinomadura decatromicini]|uniref:Uncharacterized protein n=1 Tax=Actinomadura decatromicini TaxID=2604572 RepID=A0A5D3FLQ7_9ACTN|nr:hypothetical protein [Actinomadura decatromicini]TYK49064.1 hypothetical protein FXF68_14665 [Actinomadura decatromicini]